MRIVSFAKHILAVYCAACLLAICILPSLAMQARAADRGFVVLPFAIEGPSALAYLKDAVPPMLVSRLSGRGMHNVEARGLAPLPDAGAAAKLLSGMEGADYAVWGVIRINAEQAVTDMHVTGRDGGDWKRVIRSSVVDLVTALARGADAINAEVFKTSAPAGGKGTGAGQPMNPAFVSNEIVQRQPYLNPQFRYQGADSSRQRSQSLNFAAVGMVVADADGDGKNEVALLAEHSVTVFDWAVEQMKQISSFDLPRTLDALSIHALDLDGNGSQELIINMIDRSRGVPSGVVLSFKGRQFVKLAERVPYYMNVVKRPPNFLPVLIGQRGDSNRVFASSGVHELALNGPSLAETRPLELPQEANALNIVWLPSSRTQNDGDKLIVLTSQEKLAVYSNNVSRIAMTDEKFSGSSASVEAQWTMPGLGKSTTLDPNHYYIPMRMVPADIEGRGEHTLLVNKPISVAAMFFERYRFYPEGEIHDLFWDGVGLNLLWKTRRIKGSVVDLALADIANDGGTSLVVCVNTHPGTLGFGSRKTLVLTYPLNLDQSDPDSPIIIDN
jgi:hypothetical protein